MHAVLLYPLYGLCAYISVMLLAFVGYNVLPSPPLILGFIARSMSAYLALIICATYGTIASAILKSLGLQYQYAQWTTARSFKWVGGLMTGVDFQIEGDGKQILKTTRPAVIVGNHQTELDILMLGTLFPQNCSVTAKKSLRNVPFLGWYMSLSGSIFIDRADRSAALKAFEGAAKVVKQKQQSVFMFPEGTRSYSTEPMLLPFKKGAFHFAVQAQIPILPTVAENYSRVLNVKAKRFNAGTVRIRGRSIKLILRINMLTNDIVLPAISTKGKTAADVDDLLQQTRESMLNALKEMAQDTQSQTAGNGTAKKTS